MKKQFMTQLFDIVNLIWDAYPDENIVMKILPEQNEQLKGEILRYVMKKHVL